MSYPIDNVRLPEDIETGAQVGPSFNTSIITMNSGVEQPNSNWLEERVTADISYGIMAKRDLEDAENSYLRVVNFFRARRGRGRGFLFRDPTDFELSIEIAYPKDGEPRRFELYKTYSTYRRRITRPNETSIVVYGDGVIIPAGQYNVLPKGIIEIKPAFDVPAVVQVSCDYDIPVRFDQDELMVTLTHIEAGMVPAIKIVQVRE